MLDVQDLWNFVLFISQYCSRGRKDADGLFRVYLRNFRVPAAAATIYGAKLMPLGLGSNNPAPILQPEADYFPDSSRSSLRTISRI